MKKKNIANKQKSQKTPKIVKAVAPTKADVKPIQKIVEPKKVEKKIEKIEKPLKSAKAEKPIKANKPSKAVAPTIENKEPIVDTVIETITPVPAPVEAVIEQPTIVEEPKQEEAPIEETKTAEPSIDILDTPVIEQSVSVEILDVPVVEKPKELSEKEKVAIAMQIRHEEEMKAFSQHIENTCKFWAEHCRHAEYVEKYNLIVSSEKQGIDVTFITIPLGTKVTFTKGKTAFSFETKAKFF